MILANILKQKSGPIVTVAPTDTITTVVEQLSARRIGAVLVLDSGGQLLGIVSERDVVRSLARAGAATLSMTAAQLMTRELRVAAPSATVCDAMALMTEGRFRHLPVVEDGQLMGIVSIGDVVKERVSEQDHEVDSLRAYVAGAA